MKVVEVAYECGISGRSKVEGKRLRNCQLEQRNCKDSLTEYVQKVLE